MNTRLRITFRLFCIVLCLLYGMAEMFFLFPFYSKTRKLRAIQIWSLRVMASCGMKLETFGVPPSSAHGQLVVANHISWMDIMAFNGAFPGRFVAKDDVAGWPVIGYLATQAQTVYVARNKGTAGNGEKIRTVTQALQNGDTVALFPEGTSTGGSSILPFKTSFFQAAYDAGVPIVPALCRYPNPDGTSPSPHSAYHTDISLWQSIIMIISQPESKAELHFLPPVSPHEDRRESAAEVHALLLAKQKELG
ncbi:1-acyl-sn-glycerol-3-phosphate acyltransferase [Neisseria chenwenguii]|uniref:1-acyl-sn-glycerol-3-phosphate acyltransferase n=1 Tax=Neisseria chenwenguii TaxID=1853278 RepID=A0A220RZM6_9NEIS|nr:lysophospholipid acyltransferase family protein [Neisseria chenwenguii]ASK26623.1 1-acyl-sn-glycerol-3-phosphate acyltransferase [Neisseria chenwenguii]